MMNIRKWFVQTTRTSNITIETPSHLLFFLGFLLSPILVILYIICTIFREFVRLYLLVHPKKKFHGFVKTYDAVWGVEGPGWKTIVPIVMMIKSDKEVNFTNIIRKRLKERVFEKPEDYRKLTSTFNTCMGYVYLQYDTYALDQCVSEIFSSENHFKYLENKEFSDIIQKLGQSNLPINNTALWEVMAFPKPFLQRESNGGNYFVYPLLLKFNHMMGDGAALLSMSSKIFADSSTYFQDLNKLVQKKVENETEAKVSLAQKLLKTFEKACRTLWIAYIFIGYTIYILLIRKKDKSALHGPFLSGEKHFAWITENEEKLVPLAKQIKNRVSNATFSNVVFTAVSASLTSYLKEKNQNVPETFYTAIPIVLSPRNDNQGRVILENNFGMAFTHISYQQKSLSQTLKCVRDQFAFLKQNPDLIEGYFFLSNVVVNPFPIPLLAKIPINGLTCAISNVPGGQRAKIFDGLELDSGIVFTLNRWKTGITFAVVTYDNRFLVGLLIDKSLVPNKSDAQNIVNDVFVNIQLLAKEIVL